MHNETSSPLFSVVLAALFLLSGCATLPSETVRYRCAGATEIGVVYSGHAIGAKGVAELVWEGHSFVLKQEMRGSGARYTDGTLTLVSKGDEVFVEKSGEIVLRDCNAKP